MKKVKVLFLIPHLDLGGGVRRIKSYFDYINRENFSPLLCIYSNKVIRDIDQVIEKKDEYIVTNSITKIFDFIKTHNVGVVYTFYDGQYQPFLYQILFEFKNQKIKLIGNNVFAYYEKQMDDLFDIVLFQTSMMAIKFKKNLPHNKNFDYQKYRILNNPVNNQYFSKFRISNNQIIKQRNELGFHRDDFIVGRFGRSDIVKWGDVLISAITKLGPYHQIKFLLVGVPKSRVFFLAKILNIFPQFKSRIVIVNPTSDDSVLMHYMQMVDIIGHGVNIGEGCSNAINEAMYWRKPVVTNSTPHCDNGQVEQVEHLKTGIIANNGGEFSQAIITLYQNPNMRKRLGKNGYQKAIKLYGAKKIVRAFEKIVSELITGKVNKVDITKNQKAIQSFNRKYQHNLRTIFKAEKTSIMQQVFRFLIRVINYGEYRMFNR